MSGKIKLSINEHSYFNIRYDFNVKKYVDGDVYIEFYFKNKKIFRCLTQLQYFVRLLCNMLDLCLNRAEEAKSSIDLANEYLKCLENEKSGGDIDCKTLLDLNDTGFITFLFWEKTHLFVEVDKISVDNDGSYYCETSIKQVLSENNAKEWIKVLKQTENLIGSQIKNGD